MCYCITYSVGVWLARGYTKVNLTHYREQSIKGCFFVCKVRCKKCEDTHKVHWNKWIYRKHMELLNGYSDIAKMYCNTKTFNFGEFL